MRPWSLAAYPGLAAVRAVSLDHPESLVGSTRAFLGHQEVHVVVFLQAVERLGLEHGAALDVGQPDEAAEAETVALHALQAVVAREEELVALVDAETQLELLTAGLPCLASSSSRLGHLLPPAFASQANCCSH